MAEDAAESREAGNERIGALIRAFLRDGRLIRLPAKFTRRKEVLREDAGDCWLLGAWRVPVPQ